MGNPLSGEAILHAYSRALSFPVLLQMAPERVSRLVRSASSEAEFSADSPPRQILGLELQSGDRLEFVSTDCPRESILSSGALARVLLELKHNGRSACVLLLEPEMGSEGRIVSVDGYEAGDWERLLDDLKSLV